MSEQPNINELLEFTAEIVAAHAGNNMVAQDDLPRLIQGVYKTLSELGGAEPAQERPKPAVAIKKSIHPDIDNTILVTPLLTMPLELFGSSNCSQIATLCPFLINFPR